MEQKQSDLIPRMSDSPIRVLLIGAGAVGMIYGSYLGQVPNVQVTVLARSNYSAISENGADITVLSEPPVTTSFRPHAVWKWNQETLSSYTGEPFDFVLISTKSLGTEPLKGLERFMSPEKTMLLMFQNGIEIEAPYRKEYAGIPIASAVLRVSASSDGVRNMEVFPYGLRVLIGLDHQSIGSSVSSVELTNKLKTLKDISLQGGTAVFEIVDNIETHRWEKILWNGSFNMIGALLDMDVGQMFASVMDSVETTMYEIWQVADAVLRPEIEWHPKSKVQDVIEWTKNTIQDSFVPSSVQDVRKGIPIEIEALLGNIVRAAEENHLETPSIKLLYQLLKGKNYMLQQAKDNQ